MASIAEAASGVCLQADNAEEIQSSEAAAAALAAAEAAATAAQVTAEAVKQNLTRYLLSSVLFELVVLCCRNCFVFKYPN